MATSTILQGYELATQLVPFVVALVLFERSHRTRLGRRTVWHYLGRVLFALQAAAIFRLTGTATLYQVMSGRDGWRQLNLDPLAHQISTFDYLNILLFVPLGIILTLVWPVKLGLLRTTLWGFGLSLLVETSQLFNIRATDVDDLIMNTLGALIGGALASIVVSPARRRHDPCERRLLEPVVYLTVVFLGRFLLFNETAVANALCP